MNDKCDICGGPRAGGWIITTKGFRHQHCHAIKHPPTLAKNLNDVLHHPIERDAVSKVFGEFVHLDVSDQIVKRFNDIIIDDWRKRCEPPERKDENAVEGFLK